MMISLFLFIISFFQAASVSSSDSKPNIIFMFGDDMGFNELGYHGCTQTSTPFMNQLVTKESLILMNNYVFKVCSPTRASFLTGRYPSHLGLQNFVFNPPFPVSLTRQASTISNEFKHAGYTTHMIGKWHLGMQSWEYTPRYRGFDSFAGFYGGWQTYFSHLQTITSLDGFDIDFYDLRVNEDVCVEDVQQGIYGVFWQRDKTLELLSKIKDNNEPFFLYLGWQGSHTPDEAPQEYVDIYAKQQAHPEHIFSQAQTTTVDDSMREIVTYLKANNMWHNTLLVFSSDNGGEYMRGDNYPLRGFKNASWEGGIRVPAFVSGGYLNADRRGKVLDSAIVHVTDWYPTLLSAAGIEIQHITSTKLHGTQDEDVRFNDNGVGRIDLDGKDVWNVIQFGEVNDDISSEEREVLLDLNSHWCAFTSCGAIRIGKYKFLRGDGIGTNEFDVDGDPWGRLFATCVGDTFKDNIVGCDEYVDVNSVGCHLEQSGCLFNLEDDPCEYTNLADTYPTLTQHMIHRLDFYEHKATEPLVTMDNQLSFDQIDPRLVCNSQFWCPFQDYDEAHFEEILSDKYKELYPECESSVSPMNKQDGFSLVIGYMALLIISIFAVFYVNHKHSETKILFAKYRNNLRNETVPLVP